MQSNNGWKKRVWLDVARVGYDVILGKPWLTKHNPDINWCINTVSIGDYTWAGETVRRSLGFLLSAVQFARTTRTNTAEIFVVFVKFDDITAHSTKIESLTPGIRKLVEKYKRIFLGDLSAGLSPDQPENINIQLSGDSKPPLWLIIQLSPLKLENLEKQLLYLLEHGFVKPSQSPYGALVLFTKKKDGKLPMCIDYCALNKLTIKNRYSLPCIMTYLTHCKGQSILAS